jgi:hypothetical protein
MIQSTDYQVYTNEKKIPETASWFQECEGVYLGHGIYIEHGILQFHMMWETHHITSIQLVSTI